MIMNIFVNDSPFLPLLIIIIFFYRIRFNFSSSHFNIFWKKKDKTLIKSIFPMFMTVICSVFSCLNNFHKHFKSTCSLIFKTFFLKIIIKIEIMNSILMTIQTTLKYSRVVCCNYKYWLFSIICFLTTPNKISPA